MGLRFEPCVDVLLSVSSEGAANADVGDDPQQVAAEMGEADPEVGSGLAAGHQRWHAASGDVLV